MWFSKDDEYSYTNLVINMPKSPLDEPIRREANRKVTLIELVEAFDQARKDSEEYQILEKQRKEERERLSELARKRMKGTAVEDHLEEDVKAIWEKINKFPKKTISLLDLCEQNGREELIRVLMSVLFLAYDNKVLVYQKRFPFGKIYVKNTEYS